MSATLDSDDRRGLLTAFLALQILGGHVGIPLMLLTIFFSRQIMRHPIFVNFCATWILFTLSYTLLSVNLLHPVFGIGRCII
jgi:hypothetical protein